MAEPTIETVMEAVTLLRKDVETKSLDPDKIKALNAILDSTEARSQAINALEAKNTQLNEDIVELKKVKTQYEDARKIDMEKAGEFKERIDALEAEIARGLKGDTSDVEVKNTEEYKALEEYCRVGDLRMGEEHKVLLRTDVDTDGGVLTPAEMDTMITKKIVEIDPVRGVARVRTIASKSIILPIRAGEPIAQFEGEAELGTDSASTYESETVVPFRLTHTTPITKDLLQDGAFDMESEIIDDGAEAFGFGEGNGFIVGTGFKQPQGIFIDTRLTTGARETLASGLLDADTIILITGDLKTGYAPSYMLNRRTLAIIRTFKSTTGQFLWQPGLNGPVANTLNGFPYALANSVPDVAASAFAVGFGDFRRGYTIVDRTGMEIIRDELTQKRKAIIEFTMHRWTTGQVTLPEAIKLIKIKA